MKSILDETASLAKSIIDVETAKADAGADAMVLKMLQDSHLGDAAATQVTVRVTPNVRLSNLLKYWPALHKTYHRAIT